MAKFILGLTIFISFSSYATLAEKCGTELADRYIQVDADLNEARMNRTVGKALGITLRDHLSSSLGQIYAKAELQTDERRCEIIKSAVDNIESSLNELQSKNFLQKICKNIETYL